MNMKKKYLTYIVLLIMVSIAVYRIIDICVYKGEMYLKKYDTIVNKTITGSSAPRGRILDINGKVLVDNIGVNTLIYNKGSGVTSKEKIELSLNLAEILVLDTNPTENKLKTFYMALNDDCDDLITADEWTLYKERKLNIKDIEALKYDRITNDMLNTMSDLEKKASIIFFLLSNGYSYQDKIIKKGLSDEELARIRTLELPRVRCDLLWERTYPYESSLNSIFGRISTNGIPYELKDYYMDKGLKLDSTVGVSYLEFEYDDYLRGIDAVYKVNRDNTITLLKPEKQGADLYLSIDIEKQLKIEAILKEEMLLAKKAKNTDYYDHSYVIVQRPNSGEIVAAVGLKMHDGHFIDITNNIISSSYTVGSVVKGASMSVGYKNGVIDENMYVTDGCIKVKNVTEKCSWKSLGRINDISAMAYSSNYFQFLIAVNLTNPNYKWNSPLNATYESFKLYRDMFSSYGLGVKTGIDLPNEEIGIIGSTISDDLLLNLSIGQYDTYTPIELSQYISTIANDGKRIKPSLMKKIVRDGKILLENKTTVLNEVDLDSKYISRVQEGMREVMNYGTGKNYTDKKVTSAGKTGTSETFVDTDGDGKIDTKTISNAFVMYAPFENPEYSITLLSPNISISSEKNTYKYSLNLRVNKKIVKYLFENP